MSDYKISINSFGFTREEMRMHNNGYVYALTVDNKTKIGATRSPKKRLHAFKTFCPTFFTASFFATGKAFSIEKKLHNEAENRFENTEWFGIDHDKAVNLINRFIIQPDISRQQLNLFLLQNDPLHEVVLELDRAGVDADISRLAVNNVRKRIGGNTLYIHKKNPDIDYEIEKRLRNGEHPAEISKKTGVHRSTIIRHSQNMGIYIHVKPQRKNARV